MELRRLRLELMHPASGISAQGRRDLAELTRAAAR
jgi:hypothetical protein